MPARQPSIRRETGYHSVIEFDGRSNLPLRTVVSWSRSPSIRSTLTLSHSMVRRPLESCRQRWACGVQSVSEVGRCRDPQIDRVLHSIPIFPMWVYPTTRWRDLECIFWGDIDILMPKPASNKELRVCPSVSSYPTSEDDSTPNLWFD